MSCFQRDRKSYAICGIERSYARVPGNESIVARDAWEHEGRRIMVMMASDVIRDGMALELVDLDGPDHETVPEAFWQDQGGGFDFIAHIGCVLPFAIVERFVAVARRSLPPSEQR